MRITKQDAFPVMPRIKRVAAYARVSGGTDAMMHSLSAQVSYYNDFIQKQAGWEFAGIYADEALTGTKENRLEFQRMLTDCRAGKIDMVVTKSITRFARNTVTTLATVRELKLLGIDVYFEKEGIHSISEEGELVLAFLAAHAQEESLNVSDNIKWRIRNGFKAGKPHKARMLGYRLHDGKLCIMPEEAETVKQIFADYLSGMGLQAIAKKLRDAGIPSSNRGVKWSAMSIHRALCHEAYVGTLVLQKTFISDHVTKKKCKNRGELPMYRIEDAHDPIIDKATFEAVQAEIQRRSKANGAKPQRYTFTGLIKCGICGKPYKHRHEKSGAETVSSAWICNGYTTWGKSFCTSQLVPEHALRAKATEVLGLAAFDEAVLRSKISAIVVPAHNRLSFVFKSGDTVDAQWQRVRRRTKKEIEEERRGSHEHR